MLILGDSVFSGQCAKKTTGADATDDTDQDHFSGSRNAASETVLKASCNNQVKGKES